MSPDSLCLLALPVQKKLAEVQAWKLQTGKTSKVVSDGKVRKVAHLEEVSTKSDSDFFFFFDSVEILNSTTSKFLCQHSVWNHLL